MDESVAGGTPQDKTVREFRARLKRSRDHFKDWRQETHDLYDFRAGHQWSPEDTSVMDEQKRPYLTFNLTAKFLEAVGGLQINNRQEIRYFPRENGDVGVNDLATGAVKWNRDLSDAEYEESESFADMVLCGMGFVDHRLEDTTDPEGFIAQERCDPLECFPDPAARKRNLTDGRYIIRLKPYTREEFEEFFKLNAAEYEGSDEGETFAGITGIKFVKQPQDYDSEDSDPVSEVPTIKVADYQWWELTDHYRVQSQLGSKTFSAQEWKQLEPQLKQEGAQYQAQKVKLRCYYRAFICGDKVLSEAKMPTQAGFTIKVITGKRDRNTNTWYGMGRAMLDPNKWVNKFFSSILWQLMVNPKGGLLAEKDAFESPSAAEESWADPSKITFTKPGAIREGMIDQKPSGAYPAGMDKLMQFSMGAMPEVSGINLELLGLTDRQQAGVVEASRKQSAMAIIAWAFDAMRLYYKESGRLMLELVREFMSDGRLIRISSQGAQQYVPLLKDKLTGTFDIVVDEAPTSVNMRERVWSALSEILPLALKVGIKVPPEILEYAPIPDDLAQKWRKLLSPTPEDQQKQQAQMIIAVKQALAEIRKTEGQAVQAETAGVLNTAKAAEIQATMPGKVLESAANAGAAQAGGA